MRSLSRSAVRRRTAGLVLALVAEAFLALLLLTLSYPTRPGRKQDERTLTTFSVTPPADPAPDRPPAPQPTEQLSEARPEPQERQPEQAAAQAPPVPQEAPPPPPPFILIQPGQLSRTDLASAPRTAPPGPRKSVAGPPNVGGGPPDTPRVEGSGPNGEPLYAAAWYREPYPDELRGYLSTARGPGYALIACRTVRDWRVEDCALLDEYPAGSGIGRAVMAAAWQFKVRPPRLGGQYRIGEWVRIRIDYERR